MKKTLKFIKEQNSRWYIVLPNWIGPHASLEMVAGADTFLDILSGNTTSVSVDVKEEPFPGCSELTRVRKSVFNGADYILNKYENRVIGHEMWLCNVTLFVLGGFPQSIYFSKSTG